MGYFYWLCIKNFHLHTDLSLGYPKDKVISRSKALFIGISSIVKPSSRRLGGYLLCLRFIFFSFVGNYIQTSADDVIISQLLAISQLFSSYPPSGAFWQVSKLTIQTEHGRLWEMFIWYKLGQNPSDIHVGTFAKIKNLIWDQLQATKAEIIQS